MKYMVDAMMSGLAKELKAKGIECETVHKFLLEIEDSRISIKDPEIIGFLRKNNKSITLITSDSELAKYCEMDGIPHIRVQDLVYDEIRKREP